MTTWLLIITVYSKSICGGDTISSIRFNSKASCEAQADKINRVDEKEWYHKNHQLMEVYESAECVEDKGHE